MCIPTAAFRYRIPDVPLIYDTRIYWTKTGYKAGDYFNVKTLMESGLEVECKIRLNTKRSSTLTEGGNFEQS